jgi:capsular polysaccharide biosynthesis protein
MDFWELITVMARRWYVTVPILALTAVLAVTMPARVEPTYQASGTVVLVEPAGNAADLNPIASAGLDANANALATIATLPDAQADVGAAGLSTQYSVESDGSVVVIEASGATPEEAAETVQFVEQLLTERLDRQQENVGAPVDSYLTVVPLIADPVAVPVYDDQRRVRILVVVAGVLLAALAAVAVEGLAVRRRTRTGASRRQPDRGEYAEQPLEEPADGLSAADPATATTQSRSAEVHLDGGTAGSAELTADHAARTEPLVR